MTEKEQHELIGKIVLDLKRKTEEFEALKIKASTIGRNLKLIGQQLEEKPELITFWGELLEGESSGITQIKIDMLIDYSTLKNLRDEIKGLLFDLKKLEEQKKRLGI
jgi:hypothetical protein